ncbi:MAG: hypothetical protein Q9195_008298 [Heterodermia aff. obscurata]
MSQANVRSPIQAMAALHNSSSNCSLAATGKVEPLLFRLPLELRQHIYAFIFGSRHEIDLRAAKFELDSRHRDAIYRPQSDKLRESDRLKNKRRTEMLKEGEWRTGILEVSRAVSNEALDVLYGQPIFIVDIYRSNYGNLLKLGAANLQRIRRLRILVLPKGVSYGRPFVFDPQLWFPLLEGMLLFCIVALQPLRARTYFNVPTLEEELWEWTTWLDPVLEYFRANLSKTTAIEFDADGGAETTAIMDKYFGSAYQRS